MEVTGDKSMVRRAVADARGAGRRVGLVPTMGDLHAGHLSLVDRARESCGFLVVSVFVNPLQFGPGEDFERYPRVPESDARRLQEAHVDLVLMPRAETLYPRGLEACTRVRVPGLTDVLCGASRPDHFEGVTTVVAMLLNLVQPDLAFFGEKDYQQLLVIRRMAADLLMPVTIASAPTVREPDGLALSSRNRYLDADQRARAPALHRELQGVAAGLAQGGDAAALAGAAAGRLVQEGFRVDYLEARDAETLAPPAPGRPLRVFGAAWLGATRLIDNVPVPTPAARG